VKDDAGDVGRPLGIIGNSCRGTGNKKESASDNSMPSFARTGGSNE